MATIRLRVSDELYERLQERARRRTMSVPALLRELFIQEARKPEHEAEVERLLESRLKQ